jgi:hypothetical protein
VRGYRTGRDVSFAWRRFAETDARVPEQLARAAGPAVTLVRD